MTDRHLSCHSFKSGKAGPSLLCLGAIHGNESCGMQALSRLCHELESGKISLLMGDLCLIPVCNPEANRQKKRYCEVNLNRLVGNRNAPPCYERELALELEGFIGRYDYTLDLHSNHTDGVPFIFQDTEQAEEVLFARALGVPHIVTGWPDMYQEDDFTTSGYAHAQGKISVTVECGQHDDPKSIDIAYAVLRHALDFLGMIALDNDQPSLSPSFLTIKATHIHHKTKDGDFSRNWNHMDQVRAGETIATYEDGEQIAATQDCYILLPFPEAQTGDEWFYIGLSADN